jgi:hypothetical protein
MGGPIESVGNDILKRLATVPGFEELARAGGRKTATSHFFGHLAIGLALCLAGSMFWTPIAWGAVGAFALVVVAELGEWRPIDWTTRGLGWLLGAAPAVWILLQ